MKLCVAARLAALMVRVKTLQAALLGPQTGGGSTPVGFGANGPSVYVRVRFGVFGSSVPLDGTASPKLNIARHIPEATSKPTNKFRALIKPCLEQEFVFICVVVVDIATSMCALLGPLGPAQA